MRVAMVTQSTCPRCSAPIKGDFRFCPECAFRLRPGTAPEVEEPRPPRFSWGILLAILAVGLMVGAYFIGLGRKDPLPEVVPTAGDRVLTVEDLQDNFVLVEAGVATYQGEVFYEMPEIDAVMATLWEDFATEGGGAFLDAVHDRPVVLGRWSRLAMAIQERTEELREEKLRHVPVVVQAFRMMTYEVSRGQYAEFVRAMQADPGYIAREWDGFVEALWRPPDDDAAQQYAHYYWDRWWQQVTENHREREDRILERPDWLAESNTGLSHVQGVLLLVPPEWVHVDENGAIDWRLERGEEDFPVTGISWWDATAFAIWASRTQGLALRLPTEAQWLRAFHGGHPHKPSDDFEPKIEGWQWPWGNVDDANGCNNANFALNRDGGPRPRSVRRRYAWHQGKTVDGILNMAGNAAEWVDNWRSIRLPGRTEGPYMDERYDWTEPPPPEKRLPLVRNSVLGGHFDLGIQDCSAHWRKTYHKCDRDRHVGFRLVMVAPGPGR